MTATTDRDGAILNDLVESYQNCIALLCHDLRSSLQMIRSCVEDIRDGESLFVEQTQALDFIQSSLEKMSLRLDEAGWHVAPKSHLAIRDRTLRFIHGEIQRRIESWAFRFDKSFELKPLDERFSERRVNVDIRALLVLVLNQISIARECSDGRARATTVAVSSLEDGSATVIQTSFASVNTCKCIQDLNQLCGRSFSGLTCLSIVLAITKMHDAILTLQNHDDVVSLVVTIPTGTTEARS